MLTEYLLPSTAIMTKLCRLDLEWHAAGVTQESKGEIGGHNYAFPGKGSDAHRKRRSELGRVLDHGRELSSLAAIEVLLVERGSGQQIDNHRLLFTAMRKVW